MANLIDIFSQTNSTNADAQVLTTLEDLPKDKPSLFDALLKTSIENIEANKNIAQVQAVQIPISTTIDGQDAQNNQNSQNTQIVQNTDDIGVKQDTNTSFDTTNLENQEVSNLQEEALDDSQKLENKLVVDVKKDNKIEQNEIKTKNNNPNINNKNSILDRLVLEVKNSNTEKIEDIKNLKDMASIQSTDENFLRSLDEKIDELNSSKDTSKEINIDKKVVIKEDSKIIEQIQKEAVKTDLNTIIEIKTLEETLDNELNISKDISQDSLKDITKKEINIDKKVVINENDKVIEQIQKESIVTTSDTSNIEIKSLEKVETKTKDILISTKNIEVEAKEDNKESKNSKEKYIQLSLMDQLIQANSNTESTTEIKTKDSVVSVRQVVEVKEQEPLKSELKLSLMDRLIKDSSLKDTNISVDKISDLKVSKDVSSNIFLAEQKNTVNTQLLFNKNEAVQILENASSLKDIEKSATILDLNASRLEVEQDITKENLERLKLNDKELQDRKNLLNNLLNEKNIRSVDVRNLITSSIEASKALLENSLTIKDDVVLDVQPSLVNSIQTRIIGAKQQLSSMMSDIARTMYENYKPPVTAFRMNLNPADLGSISILMKQDKTSGLSISMSISSLATLELMMDNQNSLRNSLVRTFNDGSNFNLDFSSSQDNNQDPSSNSNNQKRDSKENLDTQNILNLKEENKDMEVKTDYM